MNRDSRSAEKKSGSAGRKTEHYMTESAGRSSIKGDRNRGGRDQPFAEHGGRKDF